MTSLPTRLVLSALAAIMPASSALAQATRVTPDLDPSRLVADQLAVLAREMVEPGPNQEIRDAAARRLLSIGTAEARNAVQASLRDPGNNPARLAAVRAVAEDLPPDPEFVDVLFVLLEPDVPRPITDAAVAALGNYKLEPDVSRRLVDLTKPVKPEGQRLVAIRALSAQIEKRAAEQLVLLTRDPSPTIAAAATEGIRNFASLPLDSPADWWRTQSDHGDERFRLETLAARSAKSESEVRRGEETTLELRRSVVSAITSAPREQRGAVLTNYLKSPREAVRLIAVTQAYEFATTGDLPEDTRPAIRGLIADAEPDIRLVAAKTINVLNDGEAFAGITRQVAVEPDARVRAELARAMGPMGNLEAVPLLRWLLDDSSTPVVMAASTSLARLAPLVAQQNPTAAAELAIRLQAVLQTRAGADARVRESLLEALVPLKQRSMLATFSAILAANPRDTEAARRFACAGLGAIGEPKTAAILVDAMRDFEGSAAVRGEAAKAIGQVSTTFEHAEAIYRAMIRETDAGVAATEWATIRSLLPKAPEQQLVTWPDLAGIAGNNDRLLDVDHALKDLAIAGKDFDKQTFYQGRIGDTLMRVGEIAEAVPDKITARQRFAEATAEYESALKVTRDNGGKSMRIDKLVTNTVRAKLRARNYTDAVAFASQELGSPNGSRYQDIIGPEFKLEAERLADPNGAKQENLDDALSLVKEALAMSPRLADMYRGHLAEVQAGVESRQHQKNEYAWPEFWQALAMATRASEWVPQVAVLRDLCLRWRRASRTGLGVPRPVAPRPTITSPLSADNFPLHSPPMNQPLHHRTIILLLMATSSGCSWFGWGKKDVAGGDTEPLASQSIYKSPLKADPDRTGDYRRDGVLDSSGNIAAAPVMGAPANDRPLVLLPPTTRPVSSTSSYLVLGSIVANVNGKPIYAHELMKQVAPLLRARARDLDETQFRKLARNELEGQRRNLIKDELTYAAAQRNTTPDEVHEAQARTFYVREQVISQAGGSLEMARQLAKDQGEDLDAMLKKEERRQLVIIYYRKRMGPRVATTVDEMRRYYEQNRDKQFTVSAQASIRLIRIDLKDVGAESAALDRINEAKRRADAGEPFESLCAEYNRMPLLVDSKGMIGPLSKGSYVIQAVDDAIWPTPQGKTSPVIKTKDAFYVFQVVEKQDGRTMAFEEPAVQKEIESTLREQKLGELTKRNDDALLKDAVIQADDVMLQPVVEMAMQMYGEWKNGTAAAR